MSELLNARNDRQNFRWRLLNSGSALALLAAAAAGSAEAADQSDGRPTVWIELGGQAEQVNGFGDPFDPPFTPEIIADGFGSPLKAQRALGQSFGGEGAVSFQPENSDWIFSASIRYGRANGGGAKHEQSPGGPRHISATTPGGSHLTGQVTPPFGTARFSETHIRNSETHSILDFQAGKDVGLGLFGGGGHSLFSLGVRVAQFSTKQLLAMNADPDFYVPVNPLNHALFHHNYMITSHAERSFQGVGPSASWNASLPIVGNTGDAEVTLDWGANAALLFGRQRAQGHHGTTGTYFRTFLGSKYQMPINRSGSFNRSRTVIVPNIGGFAGASFLYSSAKVSFGYRGDFFFGAMDAGNDAARKENVGFYGPFASVSVGLGG